MWIEEHLQCCGLEIEEIKEPYSAQDLVTIKEPCARIKILYSLLHKFDIDIDPYVYNKFKRFSNIIF